MAGLNHSRPMLLECEAEVGNIYRKSVLVTVLVGHRNSLGRKRKKMSEKLLSLSFFSKKLWNQFLYGNTGCSISQELAVLMSLSISSSFTSSVFSLFEHKRCFNNNRNRVKFGCIFYDCWLCAFFVHHINKSTRHREVGVNIRIYCSPQELFFDWNNAPNHTL